MGVWDQGLGWVIFIATHERAIAGKGHAPLIDGHLPGGAQVPVVSGRFVLEREPLTSA